jgi:phage shock protein PspC (stress-responsive transcriptional regulator)
MKKIININFHSRVVPIEETAYEILQQYIESLRRYFANEEGRDEIISDIENRFAELFSERLKKGSTCITDDDVNAIIASMGRPEELEEEETAGNSYTANSAGTANQGSQQQYQYTSESSTEYRRLYRSGNDKILGGVCGGLANYFKIDPAVVRIVFFLLMFGWALGILLYIILWIVLPSKDLPSAARKRLYRNPEDRVIAGVASGIAAYFHWDVWIPRLIFALPLVIGAFTSIIRHAWWYHYNGPVFITGGLGGTLTVLYIILWIVLPEATTASEKLEMRGEKVDLESIKNTIKTDLENFNKRARDMGAEMKESFQKAGDQMKQKSKNFAAEAYPAARRTGTGLGHAIGVVFKAFFLFIVGCICFVLITALGALVLRGGGALRLKDFILEGYWQNLLAWATLILFFVLPVIALLTWLIRRLTGIRTSRHYLAPVFATLWVIGLFCFIGLVAVVVNNFRARQHVEEEIPMSQPSHGKLIVKAAEVSNRYYDTDTWDDFGWSWNWRNRGPFYNITDDSIRLNTIKVNVVKSNDSSYHTEVLRFSHGHDASNARTLAEQIRFNVTQSDSVIYLPNSFVVNREQRFRNQQVLVILAVPLGKRIYISNNVEYFHWFNIDVNKRHITWNEHWDDDWGNRWDSDDWDNGYHWTVNTEYTMTADGLVRTNRGAGKDSKRKGLDANSDDDRPEMQERQEQQEKPEKSETPDKGYRYKAPDGSAPRSTPPGSNPHNAPSEPKPPKPQKGADSSKSQNSAQVVNMQAGRHHELLILSSLLSTR